MSIRSGEASGLPLGKIIAIVTVVCLALGVAGTWFVGLQAEKKADTLQVAAKDQLRLAHLEAALLKINEALSIQEKASYLNTKADILIAQEKFYEADQVLDKAVSLAPDNAHYHYQSSLMALNTDDLEKSETQLAAASKLSPDNADYRVYHANILMRQSKVSEAKALFEELVTHDPQYKFGWDQYVTNFTNQGRYVEAIAVGKRALKVFPNDSDSYFLLATAYDHAGRKTEAVSAYYRSLALEPMEDSIAASRIFEITGKHVPPALENMVNHQISFETEAGVMFTQATVNAQSGRFLLDTGASFCVLYERAVPKYKLRLSPYRVTVQTGNGLIQVPIAYGDLQLGQHRLRNVVFGIVPNPHQAGSDGIIGMNFLGRFRMDIDRNTQKITLTKGQ